MSDDAIQPITTNELTDLSLTEVSSAQGGEKTPKGESEKTSFNTMAELKEHEPKLYNQIMNGLAQQICRQVQDHQDRLRKIIREGRNA